MNIYDPIAEALGMTPLLDVSEYPKIDESQIIPIQNGACFAAGWNKGLKHTEGQRNYLLKTLSDGTHNFMNVEWRLQHARKRVENGSYSSVSKKTAARQLADGTHPFLHFDVKTQQANLLKEGKHHSQVVHICPHCGHQGKGNGFKRYHFDRCKSLQHSDLSNL